MVVCISSTTRKESESASSLGMTEPNNIDLSESLQCAICYNEFEEPKALPCGHSICNPCLNRSTLNCSQCRRSFKLRDIVPNIELQRSVNDRESRGREREESASQLISTQDDKFVVNEEVLQKCFQDKDIEKMPVCIISVLGEKRTGKSTLMSCIVRALKCMEQNQSSESWRSSDQFLREFECRQDSKPVTKGIWIYNKHFKIKNAKKEEMAVFVLDIEGSLDNNTQEKLSIKISTLSILLSSYQIVNTANRLKTTDFSYLKDYLDLEEIIGGYLEMKSPKIDILVRDWQDSQTYNRSACYNYLKAELEGYCSTKSEDETRLLQKTLKNDNTNCFFLPHPGKTCTSEKYAKLKDMDKDFLEMLNTYINDSLPEMVKYPKAYKNGKQMTCSEFGKLLKNLCEKTESCSFESKEEVSRFCEGIRIKKEIDNLEKYMNTKTPSVPPMWKLLTPPGSIRVTEEDFDKHLCDYLESNATKLTKKEKSALREKTDEIFKAHEMAYNQYKKEYGIGIGKGIRGVKGIVIGGVIGGGIGGAIVASSTGLSVLKISCIFLSSVGVGCLIPVIVGSVVVWYFSCDNGDTAADNKKNQ